MPSDAALPFGTNTKAAIQGDVSIVTLGKGVACLQVWGLSSALLVLFVVSMTEDLKIRSSKDMFNDAYSGQWVVHEAVDLPPEAQTWPLK